MRVLPEVGTVRTRLWDVSLPSSEEATSPSRWQNLSMSLIKASREAVISQVLTNTHTSDPLCIDIIVCSQDWAVLSYF